MTRPRDQYRQAEANRATSSLAGLAVALLLVVLCLFLIGRLTSKSHLEDCLMAGRSNCEALLTGR